MDPTLRVLACQIAIPAVTTPDLRDQHLEILSKRISEQLKKSPADLVVLPELSSIEYSRTAFDNLEALAEPIEGPTFDVMRTLAKTFDVAVVYGIPRRGENGYHIAQVAVGPDGEIIGHFDKLHIAQYGASPEKEYFERGDHLFVFECRGVRIAPIICYDIRIPELTRTLALQHSAQLILHCGAYARDESFHSWHPFVVSRAVENQVYMLSLNRAGANFGNSLFCGPWVDPDHPAITFPDTAEAMLMLDVDRAQIETVRSRYSFLADRLGDYGLLPTSVSDGASKTLRSPGDKSALERKAG